MTTPPSASVPAEVEAFLRHWFGEAWSAHGLHGDASVRAYYRVATNDGATFMLAYYPESVREGLNRFLSAYRAIEQHARVPSVVQHGESVVAQDDVGDATLFQLLKSDRSAALPYYRQAIDLLIDFQQAPAEARMINPPFDRARFRAELQMTEEFFLERLLREKASFKVREMFDRLCDEIVKHPYVLCHRDYHGQNLHIHNDVLFVIDYQDLRMGPDTYDLASLLRDRGVGDIIGEEQERRFIDHYAEKCEASGDIIQRYFESLLQRSLKVVGTFARQAVERERLHYLEFIPPALSAIRTSLHHLPQYRELEQEFPLTFAPHQYGPQSA